MLKILEGKLCVRVAVAFPDNQLIHQAAVREVKVRKGPMVSVTSINVVLHSHRLTEYQTAKECTGFLAERFDGFVRVNGFRRIDADQPHSTNTRDDDGVAVHDPLNDADILGAR